MALAPEEIHPIPPKTFTPNHNKCMKNILKGWSQFPENLASSNKYSLGIKARLTLVKFFGKNILRFCAAILSSYLTLPPWVIRHI
jgi:hypothetical protein